MIEESYVSFDTARMLKEVGFEEKVNSCFMYDKYADKDEYEFEGGYAIVRKDLSDNYNCYEKSISRPTQSLAARWIREVHNIDIVVNVYNRYYYCCDVYQNKHLMLIKYIVNANYEESLETGLQEAIKLIKK